MIFSNFLSCFFLIEYILIYHRLMKILEICVRRTFKLRNLIKPIDKLSSGKSPGPDGLTPEFYKFFKEDLRDLLFQVFLESIHNNALASTMKQGLITLIPK